MRVASTADVARAEGITPRAVVKRIAEEKLAAVKVPGRGRGGLVTVIPQDALDDALVVKLERNGAFVDVDVDAVREVVNAHLLTPARDDGATLTGELDVASLEREPFVVDELPPGTYLAAAEVADILAVDPRSVRRTAAREGWPSLEDRSRGGAKKLYPLRHLPLHVQARYLERQRLDLVPSDNDDRPDVADAAVKTWLALPTALRREALRRARILESAEASSARAKRRCEGLKRFVEKYRADHPLEKRLSVRSVYRWRRAFEADGLLALVPDWESREYLGMSSLTPEMKAFLDLLYLDQNRPSAKWCCQRLAEKCRERGWRVPGYGAVRRYLVSIPAEERTFHREGQRAWENKFLPSVLRDYDSIAPNDIWCADHCQLDVAVLVKDRNGNLRPIFPWLTAIEDLSSRAIVGWALAETPSSSGINVALLRALRRFGVPKHLLVDNGRDFASKQFTGGAPKRFRFKLKESEVRGAFSFLKIEPHFAIPGNPKAKPIERFFGTFKGDFEVSFPGYRGHDVQHRPEKLKDELTAADELLYLGAMESEVGGWLETYNATWEHGGLDGRAPLDAWNEWAKDSVVRKVEETALRLIMMTAEEPRKVGRFGVTFQDQHYWHEDLAKHHDRKVLIRYEPDDLSRVVVHDLEGRFVCVAGRRGRTPFLGSVDEHKRIQALKKKKKRALREAREASAELAGGEPTLSDKLRPAARVEPETPFVELAETGLENVELPDEKPPAAEVKADVKENGLRRALAEVNRRRIDFEAKKRDDKKPKYRLV